MSHSLVHMRDVPMIKKIVLGLLLLIALELVGLNSIGITPVLVASGGAVFISAIRPLRTGSIPRSSRKFQSESMKEKTASFSGGGLCKLQRAIVQQDEASSAPWPVGSAVSGIDPELQALLETLLEQDNSRGLNTRALLLVHGGEIKAEAYGQGMTSESKLLGWSMAKSLNAIMLGNLEMMNGVVC